MSQTLDISTFIVPGHVYTFSIKSSGLYRPLLNTVQSELDYIATISGVSVKLVGGVLGFFADQFDVTFTYVGDGSDVVANIVQQILDATSVDLASFDFIGAVDNTFTGQTGGIPTEGTTAGGGAGATLPSLPTTSNVTTWLVLGVIGIGLIVFLTSGGPSVTRRLAG